MAYRYTGLSRFLAYAENVTTYWLNNIPDDHVPKVLRLPSFAV
jgi:hypothetical protein